jgi:hypothetical protein
MKMLLEGTGIISVALIVYVWGQFLAINSMVQEKLRLAHLVRTFRAAQDVQKFRNSYLELFKNSCFYTHQKNYLTVKEDGVFP